MADTAHQGPEHDGLLAQDARASRRRRASRSGKLTTCSSRVAASVKAIYTLWLDGTFSNVQPLAGEATASGFGSTTAAEALRAVTESRVKTLLDAIKAGQVVKVH
jgi:hypothetical protein